MSHISADPDVFLAAPVSLPDSVPTDAVFEAEAAAFTFMWCDDVELAALQAQAIVSHYRSEMQAA